MRIQIFENGQFKTEFNTSSPFTLGRQDGDLNEPPPYQFVPGKDQTPGRLIIVASAQRNVAWREVKVSKTEQNQLRFENLTSAKVILEGSNQADLLKNKP